MEKSFDWSRIHTITSSSRSAPSLHNVVNDDLNLETLLSQIPQEFLNRITDAQVEVEAGGEKLKEIRIEFRDQDNVYSENNIEKEKGGASYSGYDQAHNAASVLDVEYEGLSETITKLSLTQPLTPTNNIVRGDFSQTSFHIGNPCTAMAAVAIVFASKMDVHSFDRQTINNILQCGKELYIRRRKELNEYQLNLNANEIAGPFNENITINVQEEESLNGILDIVTGSPSSPNLPRLWKSIEEFLEGVGTGSEDKKFGILTANFLSLALIVQGNCVFLFDSHSRDEYGRPISSCGTACLIRFDDRELAPRAIADHVLRNCEFTCPTLHADDVSLEDLQYFQYSITPVTIS